MLVSLFDCWVSSWPGWVGAEVVGVVVKLARDLVVVCSGVMGIIGSGGSGVIGEG